VLDTAQAQSIAEEIGKQMKNQACFKNKWWT
jgi:hypothetical protein